MIRLVRLKAKKTTLISHGLFHKIFIKLFLNAAEMVCKQDIANGKGKLFFKIPWDIAHLFGFILSFGGKFLYFFSIENITYQ